ncbi:MAG TPA: serine hydrolase [Bryobacteraceae bacterium]|nr:serine hydrolase [Bryobacteraceae bacterium]
MLRRIVIAALVAFAGQAQESTNAIGARLDAVIRAEMQDKALPALSIALVDHDRVVWTRDYGDIAGAVYRVGSVSKLFTDIGIMQLVERGRLDLDAPVNRYLPNFHPHNPFGKPITLRELMSHRSGLVREPPVGHYLITPHRLWTKQ